MGTLRTILVVEDDYDIRQALAALLRDEGFEVELAADGVEALESLRRAPAHLILLDLRMPRMNGWDFRKEQLADSALATIPVILMSAEQHLADHAQRLGAAGYLSKPLDPVTLLSELQRARRRTLEIEDANVSAALGPPAADSEAPPERGKKQRF